MLSKRTQLAMLAIALNVSAGAIAQTGAPPLAAAFAQRAPAPGTASTQSNKLPTAARLNQAGAIVIAPPILRNAGKTVATPDRPLLGRLNLHTQPLRGSVIEPPPAMQPAPIAAAMDSTQARN